MGSPVPVDTSISQVLNPWNGGGGEIIRDRKPGSLLRKPGLQGLNNDNISRQANAEVEALTGSWPR